MMSYGYLENDFVAFSNYDQGQGLFEITFRNRVPWEIGLLFKTWVKGNNYWLFCNNKVLVFKRESFKLSFSLTERTCTSYGEQFQ